MSAKSERYSIWTFTAYAESMPENWLSQLKALHVPCGYVLHDKDVWTAEDEEENPEHKAGTPKKAHYHFIAKYESLKTLAQVRKDFEFTGIAYFLNVRAFTSMCRYLLHMDEEDKYHYPAEDFKCVSAFEPNFVKKLTKSEELQVLCDITEFVEDNDISEFASIWNYSARNEPDWLNVLSSKSAYGISQYIRSRRCAEHERSMRERERERALLLA